MAGNRIFGGLSHVVLGVDEFELGHGVFLRRTYAHHFSAQMMAFTPAPAGQHHPPPWRAAKGGFSYDIKVELSVPTDSSLPGDFGAEETVWLIAALLRLARYPFLIVPIISDQSFSDAANSKSEPTLRPHETNPRILKAADVEAQRLDPALIWLKTKWESGAALMKRNPKLLTALRVLDCATMAGQTSASLLGVWGGLEQLFSPARSEIRFRVSAYIASYLEKPGPDRLALYKFIMKLYDERSHAAHTAETPDQEPLIQSYITLRNAIMKMIELDEVPTQEELERSLFLGNLG